jgi:hypothetical protein
MGGLEGLDASEQSTLQVGSVGIVLVLLFPAGLTPHHARCWPFSQDLLAKLGEAEKVLGKRSPKKKGPAPAQTPASSPKKEAHGDGASEPAAAPNAGQEPALSGSAAKSARKTGSPARPSAASKGPRTSTGDPMLKAFEEMMKTTEVSLVLTSLVERSLGPRTR